VRFWFRLGRGVGVSVPWWLAIPIYLIWYMIWGSVLVVIAAGWVVIQLGRWAVSARSSRIAAKEAEARSLEAAQYSRIAAERAEAKALEDAKEAEARSLEAQRHLMGQVSGYSASDDTIRFSVQDWTQNRDMNVTVPRSQAPPDLWAALQKVHEGSVVIVDFPQEEGSHPSFRAVWNADGTPGPDNDDSPEMTPDYGHPAWYGYERFRLLIEEQAKLEEAKRTGHYLLEDGEAAAWHGFTPSGQQCHHRHRTPQAATQCAARMQQGRQP
jgi:hypothetical protein